MPPNGPDNANPIIHNTAGSTNRHSRRTRGVDLTDDQEWAKLSRNAEGDIDDDDQDSSMEDIDSEEIFGAFLCFNLVSRSWSDVGPGC
jgi:hypothetical protein